MKTAKVTTECYEAHTGHKPRPSQTGIWDFMIQRREGEFTEFRANGSYRAALREAKAEAKLIGGATLIIPQP